MEPIYLWHAHRRYGGGKVDAEVYIPSDPAFSLKVTGAPGKLIDDITSSLNGAYERGRLSVQPTAQLPQPDVEKLKEESYNQGFEAGQKEVPSESTRNKKLKKEILELQDQLNAVAD